MFKITLLFWQTKLSPLNQSKYPPLTAAYTTLSLSYAHFFVENLSLGPVDEAILIYKLGSERSIFAYPPVNLWPNGESGVLNLYTSIEGGNPALSN